MEQDRYVEAAEAYGGFVRMHPTHEQTDYAAFREALARLWQADTSIYGNEITVEHLARRLADLALFVSPQISFL